MMGEQKMKRYYLAEIEQVTEDGMTFWRCRASAYSNMIFEGGEILTGPDGIPVNKFALVLVKGKDHAQLLGDPKMTPLPDFPLDGKMGGVHVPTRSKMSTDFSRLGIPATVVNNDYAGFREVIRQVGRINNPSFDENDFDVNE